MIILGYYYISLFRKLQYHFCILLQNIYFFSTFSVYCKPFCRFLYNFSLCYYITFPQNKSTVCNEIMSHSQISNRKQYSCVKQATAKQMQQIAKTKARFAPCFCKFCAFKKISAYTACIVVVYITFNIKSRREIFLLCGAMAHRGFFCFAFRFRLQISQLICKQICAVGSH